MRGRFRWPSRCHGLGCREMATTETLIGSRLCDTHFSLFYFGRRCPLEGRLGERLPLSAAAIGRFMVLRCRALLTARFWRAVPGRVTWRTWLLWHDIWWPIQWHVPSWWGLMCGRKRCEYCDRHIVTVLDKRGIWICDSCRDRSFSKTAAIFGGDAGRNQACAQCGGPADSEVYGWPYCHAHGHEKMTGKPYVPPTEEEILSTRALWLAMQTLDDMDEGPEQVGTGRVRISHMDGNYLRRLAKTTKRIYDDLKRPQ